LRFAPGWRFFVLVLVFLDIRELVFIGDQLGEGFFDGLGRCVAAPRLNEGRRILRVV